jgi:hypothetical protein
MREGTMEKVLGAIAFISLLVVVYIRGYLNGRYEAEKVAVRRILDELGISESERKIQLNLTTGEVSEATDEIYEAAD